MLEDIMPGEVVLSRVCRGKNLMPSEKMDDPDRKLQEMEEKLEKSEAGRKKLRQAIAMLKEKMEATEKVLQVNETLRQECEKERLRAETESKKAEEEKALRVQIEGENRSVKEQLVGVLQRLHAVERNAKSDRAETLKLRGEMKQALSALDGALHVTEAAQSSLEGLEKVVQDKVNDAVSSSSRALSMAQSVTSDVKAAQGAAASAEKISESLSSRLATVQKQSAGLDQRVTLLQQETSKALSLTRSVSSDAKAAQVAAASAEKTSQSLVSRIAAVQKQSAGLDQRVNVLQQELRTRITDVGATPSGARTANGAVPCVNKKVSNKGMVLSKSQQPIVSGADNLKPAYRSSVIGSCALTHDALQKETVAGLSGRCVQPKGHLEAIPLVDSSSSADCASTVSRELELSKYKVSNSTRGRSVGNIMIRKFTASSPVSVAAPRVPKPADTPTKCAPYHKDAQVTSGPANEAVGRANVDSCSGSFPASGEPGEKRLSNTNISIPHISPVTRRKVSSKKCLATGPINSDFRDRQRECGAVNTAEDKAQTLPLRVTEAEKGLKAVGVGEDKVLKGQRKVKLPAALLKDITKLFNKEKKVQGRMEVKLMALEQVLQSGCESGTIAEELSAQVTRKRKHREKVSDRKSKEEINEDCHQNSGKKTRIDTAAQPGVAQAVEDCSGSLGKRASRNRSKDPVVGDPSTPVQSTPPFALPQVSECVVAEISGTAKLPERSGKEGTEYDSRAVSSVSEPNDGDRCSGLGTQLRKGLENGEENNCEGGNWFRDIPADNGGMNERIVTCSSGLLERARTSGNDREHTPDMDIDRSIHKPILEIPEGPGPGWETESEFSDDDFDPEWWNTEIVLLSPTLPQLQRSTPPQGTPLDPGVTGPEPKEMSLEDLALFLEVLPPITGEECEEAIKDVELQRLPDTQTLDKSFSNNVRSTISISPKFQEVEVLDEVKATQKQDNCGNTGGPRICSSPLSRSFAPTPVRDTKITREDPREEEDTGHISTNVFEAKVVSDDTLVNTGCLKVLGQSQTCIDTSAVEADGRLGDEDEGSIVRDSVASRGLILVTGVGPTDKVLLTHEANGVLTPRSPANLRKSLESGDETGVQENLFQVPALILTVGNKLENPGVDGSLGKDAIEISVRDSVASRGAIQVTGMRSSSNLAVPPPESNTVPKTDTPANLQRSLDCQSGEEGRGVQETECTSKIEDVYPEPNCEGEVKSNPPYGLKLLAGFLGENKSLDFPNLNMRSRQQIPSRTWEIASVAGRTRDCLVHALKHHSTCEVKSWTASNDLASSLEKTRLSGMNLLSIFTGSLIDAYAWWESETSARAPAQCRSIEFLFLLVNEVFKAELFRRVLSPDIQIVDIFADQLQEFLIQGSVRPVLLPEVENTSCDYGDEVITFQIPSATSDPKRTRIVTSASKLLASLCLGAGMMDHLRKSVYLMLRYSCMDSSWLLAATSSFATVCGRQLFSAGTGDVAGQAVRVVISELLNDSEGTLAPRNGTSVTDSPAVNVDDSHEEGHEQSSDAVISRGEVRDAKISSTNFQVLRDSVGKFENDLNFEAVLPKILQVFLNVISPKELLDSQYISRDSAYRELHEQSGGPFGASRVQSEWAANTVDGAHLQPCQKVDLEEIDACCWLCSHSTNGRFRSTFVKTMDPDTRSGDPCIAWGQKFHGVTHALELIACHLGWEWTYNDLIVEHLWKCVYPGAPDTTVAFVATSIGIFGRLGIEADGTELQGVEELRRILTAILRSGHKVAGVDGGTCAFSFTAQVAAAQSLVNLSREVKKDTGNTPGPLSDSQASLLAWFQALDPTSRESLPSSLRSLQYIFGG